MREFIQAKRAEVALLCQRFGVQRMYLFGSVVNSEFDVEHSDIDVLVEFADLPDLDRFESYFGLKESLERLFGRPVDIISAVNLRNPYFRERVLQTREELYAA
jgi:predicted nucleotidyltransferase